jgi:hypothetical protein
MKNTKPFTIIIILIITSLACQTLSNFSEDGQPNTPEASVTIEATEISIPSAPPADGWIAFVDKNNIWLIHPDGSDLKQITTNPVPEDESQTASEEISMEWSPDGQRLAFAQSGRLYSLDISTLAITLLGEDTAGEFDWSPTGLDIVYDTTIVQGEKQFDISNKGLWIVNVTNGSKKQLVPTTEDAAALFDPQLSSDGNYAIFNYPGGFEPGGYGVAEISSGKLSRILTYGNFAPHGCKWMPDQLIITCIHSTPEVDPQLVFLDVRGDIQQQYPVPDEMSNAFIGRWSSNGKYLAIGYYDTTRAQADDFGLTTGFFSPISKKFQMLASGLPHDWSSDGQWIALEQINQGIQPLQVVHVPSAQVFSLVPGESVRWQPIGVKMEASQELSTPSESQEVLPTLTSLPDTGLCTDTSLHMVDRSEGNFLQICADGTQYEIGPLQHGAYAIGPNKKFFVYCTNNGDVYAGRIGETNLALIGDIKEFSIIVRKEAPELEFEFFGDHPYTVKVKELILEQSKDFPIPRYITTPN